MLGLVKQLIDVGFQNGNSHNKNSLPKWASVLDYKILGQRGGYKSVYI